ncbi:MAG: hypothetical protein JOZ13_13675 [Alphaproteobacteria bacterium]|nr:hypothetical protein [Alphaproteobacteria bacterium]
MAKFRLEKAVESSYSFAFFRFLSVLGIAWFPTVVFVALICAVALVLWPEVQGLQGLMTSTAPKFAYNLPPEEQQRLLHLFLNAGRFFGLVGLAAVVTRSMILVGVLETALGKRQGPNFFFFSLGAPVWRLIGAVILACILTAVVAIVTGVAGGALFWAVQHFAPQAAIAAAIVLGAIGALWMIYFVVRLFFLLPPAVVAEERIAIGRAWSLGGGNFWRIFALALAIWLPVAIVASILSSALFGMQRAEMFKAMMGSSSLMDAMHVATSHYGVLLIAMAVFQIVYLTLQLGLGAGAMASAYKGASEG